MLELDDIQHYLLTRPRASIAKYIFISFRTAEAGRNWVNDVSDIVGIAKTVLESDEQKGEFVGVKVK